MIEVEKKFIAGEAELKRLLNGAELVSEKTHTDIYYDTAAYQLTTRSLWLRRRNDRFELKFPTGDIGDTRFTQYDEIEEDGAIAERLGLALDSRTLLSVLETNGFSPFATITTKRAKYRRGNLSIDVDETDYGYRLVEIEAMVEAKEDVPLAYERIREVATEAGLHLEGDAQARGKVLEYLYRFSPDHFKALEKAWGRTL